uniref:non-specific serine/threonine protein kinase n=1 Tax=Ananas comosus var. bracteatus TaxID=296719 RepID=A0A6V7QFB9_ANACO|nr:unnamed protein product [Ananas comosus var. bracteatus]
MKVVDKMAIAKKKKLERAATERRILRVLDHPFLPSLYADFDASPHYSCVVMEYCCGGDLHSLRHRQPALRFSLSAASNSHSLRFLEVAEPFRLRKPTCSGVLRGGGAVGVGVPAHAGDRVPRPEAGEHPDPIRRPHHALRLRPLPRLHLLPHRRTRGPHHHHHHHHQPPTPSPAAADSASSDASDSAPGPDPSCLPDQLFRSRKRRGPDRRFVAEPVAARSESFVGTHEYVAPEVASGGPHGSAVDWWAYGVLLYELLYGRTPFAGPTTDATLRNIVRQPLAFPAPPPTPTPTPTPTGPPGSAAARDLIARLLVKDPTARLGSRRGAADVKSHPFFKGLNFALLRTHRPPVVPGPARSASSHDRDRPARFDFF